MPVSLVLQVDLLRLLFFAAEYKDPEPLPEDTTLEDTFFDQIDDDRVLPMPDGGFLHGEIIEVDAEDTSKVIGIYNSSLDPNAVTVEEAKKIMSGEKNYIFFQEALPHLRVGV